MPIILSTEKKNSKQSKAVTTNNVKIKRKKKTNVGDSIVLHSSNLAITSKNSEAGWEKNIHKILPHSLYTLRWQFSLRRNVKGQRTFKIACIRLSHYWYSPKTSITKKADFYKKVKAYNISYENTKTALITWK